MGVRRRFGGHLILSFDSLLQNNILDRQRWKTRDDLRYAIIHWVEHTYNRRRRQRRLGRLTPVEFETRLHPRGSMIKAQQPSPEVVADPHSHSSSNGQRFVSR